MKKKEMENNLINYFAEELSQEEEKNIMGWKQESFNNFSLFSKYKNLFLSFKIYKNPFKFDNNKAWGKLENKISNQQKSSSIIKLKSKNFSNSLFFRIAAIFIIILSVGYISYDIINNYDFKFNKAYVQSIVPRGQTSQLLLPDSSKIWLNSGSLLKYPNRFNESSREIYLDGEALFDIKRDPSKPFIINTSNLKIKVLGTKFNVTSYENDDIIETTVVNGSVEIIKNKAHKNDGKIILEPNQKASYNKKNNTIQLRKVDANLYTSWIDGKYIFKNENLGNIARKIERTYDINIYFRDQELKNIRLSGRFHNDEPIEQILKIIKLTSPIDYKINNKDIFIFEKL